MINPFNPWFGVWNRDNLMKPKSKQNRKPDSNQLNIEGKKLKKNSKKNPKKNNSSKSKLMVHITPQDRSNCF